jgi:hypothetical protein
MPEFQQRSRRPQKKNYEDENPVSFDGGKSGAHYTPAADSAGDTIDDIDKVLADQERLAAQPQDQNADNNESARNSDDTRKQLDNRESSANNPDFSYTPANNSQQPQSRWQRMRSNKSLLTGIGIGGGVSALILSGFIAFLPLKLEMLVQQAMSQAMQIPQDAVEKRLKYLLSYYLASKVLGAANPADTVKGTPAESMLRTWHAAKMEQKLGIKIESNRTSNGQRATSWKITYLNGDTVEGRDGDMTKIVREINGSNNMRKFFNNEFQNASKFDKALLRLAGRKNMMRRVGVTRWAWPDTAQNKLDNYAERKAAIKKELRSRLYEVTIKRVIKRSGAHLSCLTNEQSCKDLNKIRYGTRLDDPPISENTDPANCPAGPEGDACRASAEAHRQQATQEINDSLDAAEAEIDKAIDAGGDSKEISKFISKQMLSKVAGAVGIIDTLARIVGSVDNGALNQVVFDRNVIAYTGYGAELMSYQSQMREGKLSLEKFSAVSDMLGDYGASPAWQAMIGITSPASHVYSRLCGADREETTLPKGQTVCPERMIISDRSTFTQAVWWQPLAAFAEAYLKTVGKLFDLFNKVLEITGAQAVIEKVTGALMDLVPGAVKELFLKAVNTVLTLVFGAPINGDDTGPEAGDNLAAGIVGQAYLLGESSLDLDGNNEPNGTGLGIGGSILTPGQVGAMQERIAREKSEDFAQKSVFAKLFDTSDTHSFVSQLAIRIPTSTSELGNFANTMIASIGSLFMPKSHAVTNVNPFFSTNIMYGYADSDNLNQDPAQYTEEKCKELEKEREDSYKSPKDTDRKFPIWVYLKPNHCALEKAVAASGMAAFTTEYPKDYSLENDNSAVPSGIPTDPGGSASGEAPSAKGYVWPIVKGDYKPLSNCYRNPGHTGIDVPISVGTPVHAARGGTVVQVGGPGGDAGNYVIIKHDDGHWTNYQHMSSVSVAEKQTIGTGAAIGKSGNTGFSTGPHLHFSVTTQEGLDSRNSVAYSINPIPFLPADRSTGSCS